MIKKKKRSVRRNIKKLLPPMPENLKPQAKMPPMLGFHQAPFRWLLKWMLLYRWRRRHTCPACGAVGTWKPYGRWWKDRDCKRWLCKWCGFYDGVDERTWCVIDKAQGCWVKAESCPQGTTPQREALVGGWNPWAG